MIPPSSYGNYGQYGSGGSSGAGAFNGDMAGSYSSMLSSIEGLGNSGSAAYSQDMAEIATIYPHGMPYPDAGTDAGASMNGSNTSLYSGEGYGEMPGEYSEANMNESSLSLGFPGMSSGSSTGSAGTSTGTMSGSNNYATHPWSSVLFDPGESGGGSGTSAA